MDGLKLAAAVRHRWPPVNIIVTNGMKAPHRDKMSANSIFIAKPYRHTEVLEALRSFELATYPLWVKSRHSHRKKPCLLYP